MHNYTPLELKLCTGYSIPLTLRGRQKVSAIIIAHLEWHMKLIKKMILIGLGLLVLNLSTNCILLNALGASDSISGTETADRITNAAITADLLWSFGGGVSLLSLLAGDIAGIDTGSYYKEEDVEKCEDAINGILHIYLNSGAIVLFNGECSLEADGPIIR